MSCQRLKDEKDSFEDAEDEEQLESRWMDRKQLLPHPPLARTQAKQEQETLWNAWIHKRKESRNEGGEGPTEICGWKTKAHQDVSAEARVPTSASWHAIYV